MTEKEKDIRFFDSDEVSEPLLKKTTKLDRSRSAFAQAAKSKQSAEEFEQKASEAVDGIQERRKRAMEIVEHYWQMVHDTTLPELKGPIQKGLEKEILSKMIGYATEVNNDQNEPEGMGSMAMITLLFRSIFYLRDKNNELSFKCVQLEKNLKKMSSEVVSKDDK